MQNGNKRNNKVYIPQFFKMSMIAEKEIMLTPTSTQTFSK